MELQDKVKEINKHYTSAKKVSRAEPSTIEYIEDGRAEKIGNTIVAIVTILEGIFYVLAILVSLKLLI